MRLALALVVLLAALAPARAGILEPWLRPKLTKFPGCHDEKVLADIVERFNEASSETFNRPTVMVGISHARERATLRSRPSHTPYLDYDERLIPRRYCSATAAIDNVADHKRPFHRKVLYLIEKGQGFAGTKWEVFFCIDGYDPWRVYDGHCRVLRRYN